MQKESPNIAISFPLVHSGSILYLNSYVVMLSIFLSLLFSATVRPVDGAGVPPPHPTITTAPQLGDIALFPRVGVDTCAYLEANTGLPLPSLPRFHSFGPSAVIRVNANRQIHHCSWPSNMPLECLLCSNWWAWCMLYHCALLPIHDVFWLWDVGNSNSEAEFLLWIWQVGWLVSFTEKCARRSCHLTWWQWLRSTDMCNRNSCRRANWHKSICLCGTSGDVYVLCLSFWSRFVTSQCTS